MADFKGIAATWLVIAVPAAGALGWAAYACFKLSVQKVGLQTALLIVAGVILSLGFLFFTGCAGCAGLVLVGG